MRGTDARDPAALPSGPRASGRALASSVLVFNAASLAGPAAVDSISGGYWSQLNSPAPADQANAVPPHRRPIPFILVLFQIGSRFF